MKLNTTPAVGALLALTLIMGAGNLWASWDEVHASQQRQERLVKQKLCVTYAALAALKPPTGDARAIPGPGLRAIPSRHARRTRHRPELRVRTGGYP